MALAPAAVLALYFTKSPKQGAQTQVRTDTISSARVRPHWTDRVGELCDATLSDGIVMCDVIEEGASSPCLT